MAEFQIIFTTGASQSVTVLADDLEAAIDKAYVELDTTLCWSCDKHNIGDYEATAYYDQDGIYHEGRW